MWVKICGICDVEAARGVAALRPDAVGLNFFARSPRGLTLVAARDVAAALGDEVQRVGLFVNHRLDDIAAACDACRLDIVQLHGDEPVSFLAEVSRHVPGVKLVRAIRLGDEGIAPLTAFLDECRRLDVSPDAVLVDAWVDGAYGGTGRVVPWTLLTPDQRPSDWPPLILAGGLHAGNVAEAVRRVQPWGVDVASGVESSPACKDLAKVAAFIDAARSATASGARCIGIDTFADERRTARKRSDREVLPPLPLGEGRGEGER